MEEQETLLIDRLCSGEIDAFKEFVERYKKKVYFIAYDILGDHHEAEDVSQDVFIKVYRSLHKFRKDSKMSSWLYQIAVNASIDLLRHKRAKPRMQMDDLELTTIPQGYQSGASAPFNPEISGDAALLQGRIQLALSKVSPRERTVFVMRHYNDFKINEIADTLKVSSGTVKSLLFRALKKLRKELSIPSGKPSLEAGYDGL